MIRQRLAGLLAAALVAMTLSGCWSRIEVNDLAIVSMMAVDKTADGNMELWLDVVIPGRAGGSPGEGGSTRGEGHTFIMLRASGKTILEASRQLQAELPRRIFWAHTRVILIGENLAREGLQPAIDFLTRHRELRLTNYVLVVRGSPDEVMSAQPDLEKLPVEYVREISRSRIGTVVTLGDWVRDLAEEGAEPTMGVVELSPPPPGAPRSQRAGLKLTGTALFKSDKLVGFLDDQDTRGLLWLRGEMHLGMATVTVPKVPGNITVEWVRTTVERSARLERGRVTIRLKANVEGDVSEEQAPLDLSEPKMMGLIEAEMNKAIKDRMEDALGKIRDLKTDSAGLGEVVHRQLPAAWKQLKPNWGQSGIQQTKVVIEVDAKIRRTGLSSKPKGIKEQDLIKGEK
jgi:spore germination protein KC